MGIRDYLQIVVAPLIIGVILVPDEGSKRMFGKFSFLAVYWPKNSQICPNIADLVQKVGFAAIIHYFDLDITPYRLFGIDNYKIKKLQVLNCTF